MHRDVRDLDAAVAITAKAFCLFIHELLRYYIYCFPKQQTRRRLSPSTSCWLFKIYYIKAFKVKEHQHRMPTSSGGQPLSAGEE